MSKKTLYKKLFDEHVVCSQEDGTSLLYIDRHIIHEVTSPQAFEGLRLNNRELWRKSSVVAVPDHNIPTDVDARNQGIAGIGDQVSRQQVQALEDNTKHFDLFQIPLQDVRQGIVHVIGPEQGAVLPGMTVVCGDSHTATNGALGCLARGIGTSEVEHVMATQCLLQKEAKSMLINVSGELQKGVTAKDVILYIIGVIGTAGGTGYAIEYAGKVIENMSVEGRMTICNMSIEAGAPCGMVAVDETTIEYIKNRPMAPQGENWDKAISYWKTLHSDEGADFDRVVEIDGSQIEPQVTWGTSPEMVISINENLPSLQNIDDENKRQGYQNAFEYMDLEEKMALEDIPIDYVFIGSCTNSRIEDLREAASILQDKKIASTIERAMVVPGSGLVRQEAEKEGLDKIFTAAGFEWREAGCSMCLGMNEDQLPAGKHCASTSNRNFEGRQGKGGRTHLVSPLMAAAAAVEGKFTDVRKLL
jgi:3-isopropylmalate/(R)-2-methylmalate dehydratase large subunit